MTTPLALALLAGCRTDAPSADSGAAVCATSYLTWDDFGQAFFVQWCTSCHHSGLVGDDRRGAPPGVDFDTYDGVVLWSDEIEQRVVEIGDMPPIFGPDDDERGRLAEWLACGLPEH